MTDNQRLVFVRKKKQKSFARMLHVCPQKKGIVKRVRIQTPRKPNSARRQVVKLILSKKFYTVAFVPGKGHTLKRYSRVLIRGGGARDLPGIYATCIRGLFDLKGLVYKTKRRSIYGVRKIDIIPIHRL
jgi:small subunit ribosomal protein S12